jgi:dienelactone hydrolase
MPRNGYAKHTTSDTLPIAMTERFRDRDIRFANGSRGQNIDVPSANPLNYWQAISDPQAMPRVTIDGKLFVPPRMPNAKKPPLVIIAPGSLGISAGNMQHAETLSNEGIAVFVLDPFGPRDVTSTVANQTLFSFAASAYDVVAAVRVLSRRDEIDVTRIALQGHSRGGSAVLTATAKKFANDINVKAVLAAYPWCGHQFLDPDVGATEVRSIVGDRDEWVSAQQVQGHMQAIRLRGGKATWRIVAGAGHSFDRETKTQRLEDARVSPGAPTAYLRDDGAFIHPATGEGDPKLVDRDIAVYALKAGYGVRGASIGSEGDQPRIFRDDMVGFFQRTLL